MIGAIVGAASSLASGIAGGIKARKAARKANAVLDNRQRRMRIGLTVGITRIIPKARRRKPP